MELEAKVIQKYSKYSVSDLKKKADLHFNKYIRLRDNGRPCVNCGKFNPLQAGHFYAKSSFGWLRYNEDNVHGECLSCNYFNSQSHAHGYAVNIVDRIGKERYENLKLLAGAKNNTRAHDRFSLIVTIETYKTKVKELKTRKPYTPSIPFYSREEIAW